MTLARVLEPEVMDTAEEALDYDAMDHAEVNRRFCDDLLAALAGLRGGAAARLAKEPTRVLDVGTGTARIPIELCSRDKDVQVVAIDLADHMLELAKKNVARAGLSPRIELRKEDAKRASFDDRAFDAVVSNTIVHHIPEPADMLREMWRLTRGVLFVRDLARPESEREVIDLTARYAGEPAGKSAKEVASHARQRDLLAASLRAALTLDEVRRMVTKLGIPEAAVRMTSDRHWTLAHARPS